MPSKERGIYSQREWDKMQAAKAPASKYSGVSSGSYAGVDAMAAAADSAHKEAADYGYLASALPSVLKDAFRKNSDPEFDAAISAKQNEVLGGAIAGLDKYQDITNPFTRRALAEKYQSGLSVGLNSLTSERERRQGKLTEYIDKWSGLYGAEAARKNQLASAYDSAFNRSMSIADKIENQRRYDIEQSGKGTKSTSFTENDVRKMINEAKGAGEDWETIAKTLAAEGIDVSSGSPADIELRRVHGEPALGKKQETEQTQKQQYESNRYSEANNAKANESEAVEGELYWKNGKLYRKGPPHTWYRNDEPDEEFEM